MKVPNKLSVNTRIDKNIVQAIKFFDLAETYVVCKRAVPVSQGIKATFSTGSQNQ